MFLLGKTRRGVTKIPEAPMHVTKVTKAPLSADDRVATSFFPFRATTLLGLCWTTMILVSSTLKRQFGENFIFSISFLKMSIFSGVNPLIRAADIG
jgi:hypothetical protein